VQRANAQLPRIDFTPKVKIELIAPDEAVEAIVECITTVSQTGQIGDGLVWVADVERAWFLFKTVEGKPTT
jgi:nitrogen regulatory protein P-II 1